MLKPRRLFLTCALSITSVSPSKAQDQASTRRSVPTAPSDIVVTAERLPAPTFTVKHPLPAAMRAIADVNERSERFARCAKKIDPGLLRRIVDEPVHTSRMDYSVDRAIRTNIGCYSDSYQPQTSEPFYGVCNPVGAPGGVGVCRAPYDRAAIIAEAIYRHTADIELVPEHTANRAIQQRLKRAELLRYRLADLIERQATQMALCVVALQPARATKLVRAHGDTPTQLQIAAQMLAYASPCTGATKSFTIEPLHLRASLIDAFYRWAVAAKGVQSLLPPAPS